MTDALAFSLRDGELDGTILISYMSFLGDAAMPFIFDDARLGARRFHARQGRARFPMRNFFHYFIIRVAHFGYTTARIASPRPFTPLIHVSFLRDDSWPTHEARRRALCRREPSPI